MRRVGAGHPVRRAPAREAAPHPRAEDLLGADPSVPDHVYQSHVHDAVPRVGLFPQGLYREILGTEPGKCICLRTIRTVLVQLVVALNRIENFAVGHNRRSKISIK